MAWRRPSLTRVPSCSPGAPPLQDVDHDGIADLVHEDTDQDGYHELIHEDLNGDGQLDTVHEDVDQDGTIDAVHEDVDGDGHHDLIHEVRRPAALPPPLGGGEARSSCPLGAAWNNASRGGWGTRRSLLPPFFPLLPVLKACGGR